MGSFIEESLGDSAYYFKTRLFSKSHVVNEALACPHDAFSQMLIKLHRCNATIQIRI